MGLSHAKAPVDFLRQLGDRLSEVIGTRTGAQFLRWTSQSVPTVSKPHPVYTVGRHGILDDGILDDDVLDTKPWLDDAELVAWRALLQLDGKTVYSIELRPGDWSLVGISRGPFGAATMKAVGTALALDAGPRKLLGAVLGAAQEEQEMRLLRVPALYFVALWLHGTKEDSILPLDDHPAGLKKRKPYPPKAVHDALRTWAEGIGDMDAGLDEAN